MICVSLYSASKIYSAKIKDAKLTRRYEEAEYAFVAPNVDFTLLEAQELYDDVFNGEEVFIVIASTNNNITTTRFRGIFQFDGANYDPKEEYTLTAIHHIKKIFDLAAKTSVASWCNRWPTLYKFENPFFQSWPTELCLITQIDVLENAANLTLSINFSDWLKNNLDYSTRQYMIDYAKHFRAIWYLENDLEDGRPILTIAARNYFNNIMRDAHDDDIADYQEKDHAAQYAGVVFSCTIKTGDYVSNAFCIYTPDGIVFEEIISSIVVVYKYDSNSNVLFYFDSTFIVPDSCLDLRVPEKMYDTSQTTSFPLTSIPQFIFQPQGTSALSIGENPQNYCDRNFRHLIYPYKELEVLYSQEIPSVNPLEQIPIRGVNAKISEIEDDLVNETTKITGRIYQ